MTFDRITLLRGLSVLFFAWSAVTLVASPLGKATELSKYDSQMSKGGACYVWEYIDCDGESYCGNNPCGNPIWIEVNGVGSFRRKCIKNIPSERLQDPENPHWYDHADAGPNQQGKTALKPMSTPCLKTRMCLEEWCDTNENNETFCIPDVSLPSSPDAWHNGNIPDNNSANCTGAGG